MHPQIKINFNNYHYDAEKMSFYVNLKLDSEIQDMLQIEEKEKNSLEYQTFALKITEQIPT